MARAFPLLRCRSHSRLQISRQIVKNERALFWRDLHSVQDHILDFGVPAGTRAPGRADEITDVMAGGTDASDELAVRTLGHSRIDLRACWQCQRDQSRSYCSGS